MKTLRTSTYDAFENEHWTIDPLTGYEVEIIGDGEAYDHYFTARAEQEIERRTSLFYDFPKTFNPSPADMAEDAHERMLEAYDPQLNGEWKTW